MHSQMMNLLYDRAVRGLPALGTPEEMAARLSNDSTSTEAAVNGALLLYTSLSSASGFVAGLPGFLLLPVTVPADLAGTAMLQLHMAATMAAISGRDVHLPETRDLCVTCLLEEPDKEAEHEVPEEVAQRTSVKLAERGLRFAVGQTLRWAGRRTRRAVLRRVGLKAVPLLGGVLSAGSDAYMTTKVGRCARQKFVQPQPSMTAGLEAV